MAGPLGENRINIIFVGNSLWGQEQLMGSGLEDYLEVQIFKA